MHIKKLNLLGVTYAVECIDGLYFLIPARLRHFERPIKKNLKKIIRKLRTTGWYEYVLAADMVIVILSSNPDEQLAFIHTSRQNIHRPVFFINSGGLIALRTSWNASVFVHEATHVFQDYYFSAWERKNRRTIEKDASRMQIQFLKSCKCGLLAKNIENGFRQKRGYWEWIDNEPTNDEERKDTERLNYSVDVLTELMRYILI